MSDTQPGSAACYQPDGSWSCIRDHVTEPCGDCDGCRLVRAENATQGSAAGPWCPVCRQQTPARGVYQPPNGFYEVFADHGCDGDGRKVQDADHGFLIDGKVVPQWEM